MIICNQVDAGVIFFFLRTVRIMISFESEGLNKRESDWLGVKKMLTFNL